MFDTNNIEINAAFYELFESVFDEDFFVILTSMTPSGRMKALRAKKADELSEEEQAEVLKFNASLLSKYNRFTPRVAYIGTLLHQKKYNGSHADYMAFLASCDASDFLNPEVQNEIWKKINLDQALPKSAKNA